MCIYMCIYIYIYIYTHIPIHIHIKHCTIIVSRSAALSAAIYHDLRSTYDCYYCKIYDCCYFAIQNTTISLCYMILYHITSHYIHYIIV